MAKMGRPQINIDQRTFEGLCAIQCTEEEVCSVLYCSEDTLNRWCKKTYRKTFAEISREKRKAGRASLRRAQFRLAEKNAAMAIWLGKQYLGQKEIADVSEETMKRLDSVLDEIGGVV